MTYTSVPLNVRIHDPVGVTVVALAEAAEQDLLQKLTRCDEEIAEANEAVEKAMAELEDCKAYKRNTEKALAEIRAWLKLNAR